MANIPEMKFGHIGVNVVDIGPMVDFYVDIMGFTVTDRGTSSRGSEMAFLSRDPEEHHHIVLAEGRPANNVSTVNQMSFKVNSLADVRTMYDRVKNAGIQGVAAIDHGAALSVYFADPGGNRFEIYWATPWYIDQPHAQPIDFSQTDDELLAACESKCIADPSYQSMDDWKANFGDW